MNFGDSDSNTLSIPLADFGKSYERLDEHPQESKHRRLRSGESPFLRSGKSLGRAASRLGYKLMGCTLIFMTFFAVCAIVANGMTTEASTTASRLHLQVFQLPIVDPHDHRNVRLSIRLKPGSASCTRNVCWEKRQGLEGLVVRMKEGSRVNLKVENLLDEPTMLHWHGLVVPFSQDGVPGLTGKALAKGGGVGIYDFDIMHPGTFFIHSHFKWQHQQGLATFLLAILEDDVEKTDPVADSKLLLSTSKKRDLLLFLEDSMSRHPACAAGNNLYCPGGTPINPKDVPANFLRKDFDDKNTCICPVFLGTFGHLQCSCNGKPSVGEMCQTDRCRRFENGTCKQCPSVKNANLSNTEDDAFNMCKYDSEQLPSLQWLHSKFGTFWGSYDRLLANGRTLADPQIIDVDAGDAVRLRVINSAGSVCFWLYFPFDAEVLSVDGVDVEAGVVDKQFPVCPGQRIDLEFSIPSPEMSRPDENGGNYPILAQWQGERNRTGIILRTKDAKDVVLPSLLAATKSPLIYYDLERRLRVKHDFVPQISFEDDQIEAVFPVNLTSGWIHQFSLNHVGWDVVKFGQNGMIEMKNPKPLPVLGNKKYCVKFRNCGHTGHPMHLHGHSFQVVELDGERIQNGPMRDTIQIPPRCHTATVCFKTSNPGKWLLHCHMVEHVEHGMVTSIVYM